MTKYDEEIRQVEAQLISERAELVASTRELGRAARDAVVSPQGLFAFVAVGFILGEALRPRHPASATATSTKVGLGGLIGSAAFALLRSRHGLSMARSAWGQVQAHRARKAAMGRTDLAAEPPSANVS